MTVRPRRAVLACALAATAVALALTAPAQANTTLPGNNGKIAFTTDAFAPFVTGPVAVRGGEVKCPEFAPYGAYTTDMPGFDVLLCTAEIATVNPDGTGFNQVTNNDVPDDRPAWVPGGGPKLAYQSTQLNDDDCFAFFCGYNLYDVAPDGTAGHQLTTSDTSNETGRFNASDPSYSPDGSRLVYDALNVPLVSEESLQTKQDPVFKQFNHVLQTLYTIPAGGEAAGTATPLIPSDEYDSPDLISDSQPTYSPDGSKIAFVRMRITFPGPQTPKGISEPTLTSSIYTIPATGGTPPTPVESTEPCEANIGTIQTVLTAAATGAAPTRGGRGFGPQCSWDSAPAWSPDGTKIAVERVTFPSELLLNDARATSKGTELDLLEDSDIVVFNAADGSGVTDLSDVTEAADCASLDPEATTVCAFDQKPAWSPDGTKIAFFSDRDADGVYQLDCEKEALCDDEIWTMNADGSSPAQVTNNDVDDINPDWQSIPIPPQSQPPAQPAAPQPVKPAVGVAGVRRACVRKSFHVRFRVSTANSTVKSVVVKLDGHRIRSTKKGSFTLTINGKKLKSGRHRLTITATNAAGQVTTTRKTFSVCKAAKPRRRAAPRFTG